MKAANYAPAELNKGFVVAIEIVAKPGEEEAVARGLEVMIEPTMAEPGVKLFLPYRSPSNPRAFFIFELYVEEKSWADHQQTDHFRGFVEKILPRLEKRERVPYVPYAAMSTYQL
jgi:quinol monooxygenase YgiN